MLNPIARNLLIAHYDEAFQPLNEPEYAERDSDAHPCGGLMVVRMLTRTPDGGMMQAVATLPICEKVYPSDANFFLAKVNDACSIYDALVNQGIIVRNRHRITMCENCLRITIGTPAENDELLAALKQF